MRRRVTNPRRPRHVGVDMPQALLRGVLLVVTLCGALCACFVDAAPARAASFPDVSNVRHYPEAVGALSDAGIVSGHPDGTFRPDDPIARQQFAKMVVLTLGLAVSEHDVCPFTDVDTSPPGSLYPDHFVAVAAAQGITRGIRSGVFNPYGTISRAQTLTMVVRAAAAAGVALEPPSSSYLAGTDPGGHLLRTFSDPTHGYNARLAEFNGLITGIAGDTEGSWDPWRAATRGEVCQILWQLRMKKAADPEQFSIGGAMAHVRALAEGIGWRTAGYEGEQRAAAYIRDHLSSLGYSLTMQSFELPGGRTSRNVTATLPGANPETIVLGAHYDSKNGPGANDNATGVAALLELARILADEPLDISVVFVFFGAEETVDSNPDHHHFGSRYYVAALRGAARELTRAMISVDMIGYGPEFRVRTMGRGPQSLSDALLEFAASHDYPLTYLRDPGASGWSDHEAFELAGIPAAWIEWRDDPVYHSPDDIPSHIQTDKVRITGQLLLDFIRRLTAMELRTL